MLKSLLTYTIAFCGIGIATFFMHNNYVLEHKLLLPYSLQKVYLFFFSSALVICAAFKIGSYYNAINEQLGFVYLATFALKILLFLGLFYDSVLQHELDFSQRISLLIPMAVTLVLEVIFIAKILNKT